MIWLVAAAAGLGAATAGCEPTDLFLVNVLLAASLGLAVTLAASRSRRWTWLTCCGLAVLGSTGIWLAVAGAALAIGIVATLASRRRLYGAVVVGLAVQSLLRMPELASPLASAALAAVAVAPVLVSGYWLAPRPSKRLARRAVLVLAGMALLGAVALTVATAVAAGRAERAAADARAGLEAVRDGDVERASQLLKLSADGFASTNDVVTAWWTTPARATPIVAQQLTSLAQVSDQGSRVAAAAADVTQQADYESLRYRNGRVNLERLRTLQGPLNDASDVLASVRAEIDEGTSPWVLAPLRARTEEFHKEIRTASHETSLAADAVQVLPGLLGGNGTRRYFVAFITPSEQRGSGGFMGNWAEITARDGRLELSRSGRASELSQYPDAQQTVITADRDYAARYGRYQVGRYVQDVTLSPDVPTVAKVLEELYPKAPGGQPIDGLIVVDPEGLAALLELSGPVQIDGLDTPLNSRNAVEVLTRRQYVDFADQSSRVDFLDEAGRKTFEKLLDSDLPGPRKLAELLDPVVDRQRLRFSAFDPKEEAFLARLEANGAFPRPDGRDFFSVRSQNRGNNKIDMFLERDINYRAEIDPQTGSMRATARITLRNMAPSSGLPEAIIGSNDQGLPLGTNALNLSFYSPHGLREARINDEVVSLEYQRELGYAVYSKYLEIPAGQSVTLVIDLFGDVDLSGSRYELVVSPQPMLNPDRVVASVELSSGYRFGAGATPTSERTRGFVVEDGRTDALWAGEPTGTMRLGLPFDER